MSLSQLVIATVGAGAASALVVVAFSTFSAATAAFSPPLYALIAGAYSFAPFLARRLLGYGWAATAVGVVAAVLSAPFSPIGLLIIVLFVGAGAAYDSALWALGRVRADSRPAAWMYVAAALVSALVLFLVSFPVLSPAHRVPLILAATFGGTVAGSIGGRGIRRWCQPLPVARQEAARSRLVRLPLSVGQSSALTPWIWAPGSEAFRRTFPREQSSYELMDECPRTLGGHAESEVAVVATLVDGSPVGVIAEAVAGMNGQSDAVQIVLDPHAHSHILVYNAPYVGVTLVGPEHYLTPLHFSQKGERFERVKWNEGHHGQPLLAGARAAMEVEVLAVRVVPSVFVFGPVAC